MLLAAARVKLPSPPAGEPVALVDLALELEVSVSRVEALLTHGYLQLHTRRDTPFTTLVAMPAAQDLKWLQGMLAPLPRRPLLPFDAVAYCLQLSTDDLRALLSDAQVNWWVDPVFGEVLSLEGYRSLARSLSNKRTPVALDRVEMVHLFGPWLTFSPATHLRGKIEQEIARIAKLAEPARTLQAITLWETYADARIFAETVGSERPVLVASHAGAVIAKKMEVVEECLRYGRPWRPTWHQRRAYRIPRAVRLARAAKAQATRRANLAAAKAAATSDGESSAPARSPASETSADADAP